MSINPPPIFAPLVNLQDGKSTLYWTQFFNDIFNGDTGTAWIPTITGLTISGTPTITGAYYRIGRTLVYFTITITPATNTSSVAGTTYINNFPLTITGSGACIAIAGTASAAIGVCDKATNRIFPPTWTTVTNPVIIVGLVEAN